MFHLLSPINLILLKENALFFAFVLGEFCYSNYKICRNLAFHVIPIDKNTNYSHLLSQTYATSIVEKQIFDNTDINYFSSCEFIIFLSFIRNINIINIKYNKNNKINILKYKAIDRYNRYNKYLNMRCQIPLIARWLYPLIDNNLSSNKYKIESNFNKFNNTIITRNYPNLYNIDICDNIQDKYNIIYKRFW